MHLATDDLRTIREIVKDEVSATVRSTVNEELRPISGELEALRNDIHELYDMFAKLNARVMPDKEFLL